MTPDTTHSDRISQVAEIMALGLMRLKTAKSSGLSDACGESSLAISEHRSGHVVSNSRETKR
jgi:hypothetical protein